MKRQRGLRLGPGGLVSFRRKPARTSGRLSTMEEELASQILADIPLEMKFKDSTLQFTSTGSSWTRLDPVVGLSTVAQGDTESLRDGRVYHIDSIEITGELFKEETEGGSSPVNSLSTRVLLVLDKQTSGADLIPLDVMTDGGISLAKHYGFVNLRNEGRFTILHDTGVLSLVPFMVGIATDEYSSQSVRRRYHVFHRFKVPLRVTCSATTGDIAAIVDNSLHVITCSTSSSVQLGYTCRIRFKG